MKPNFEFDYTSWIKNPEWTKTIFKLLAQSRRKNISHYWTTKSGRGVQDINVFLEKQLTNPLAQQVVGENGWTDLESDEIKIHQILKWVKNNIKYVRDITQYGLNEYWADVEETIMSGRGDCEDGATLIFVLSIIAGVNPDRIDLTWGSVVGGGHCYITFVDDSGREKVLDWCYWYTSLIIKLRKWFWNEPNYLRVWGRAWVE